jgi:uncharacterized protein involved in outer membrane biogenesis
MIAERASAAPAATAARRRLAHPLRWTLLGIALVAVLALALQPWWLAPLVAHRLSASSGRAVHFDSMWFSLSASFEPVLQLRGVQIDNAPWADRSRRFASLAAATAVFSWRSVAERRPIVALMVLRDGEVDLERREDGLRNWRLAHPDDRGPARLKVLAIRGERATLRFRHEPLALDFEVHALPNADASGAANGEGEALPTRLDVHGTWRGAPFAIDAATPQTITLLETGRMFRIRGRLESAGARLDVAGRLGDIARWPEVDAHVELAAASPTRIVALLGGSETASSTQSPLRVDGTLRGGAAGYTLSTLRARLGASDATGEVGWLRGEERNVVRAELKSDTIDLADLRSLAVRPRGSPRAVAVAGAASAAPAAASAVRPRPTDVDARLSARRVRAAGGPAIHDASLAATLIDGTLRVARAAFAIGAGRVTGQGSVDLAQHPPRADGELDVSALPIETLLGERAAKRQLKGLLHARAALRASGETIAALLASASGTVSASVSQGTISSLLDAEMGLQGGRIVRGLVAGAEPIGLRCAAAVLDVRAGRGTLRSLVVDSERTRTTGTGTVDLARRALDVVLTPQAKQPGLFVLERSIRVHGPIDAPAHELVARATIPAPEGCAAAAPASGASACSCRTGSR